MRILLVSCVLFAALPLTRVTPADITATDTTGGDRLVGEYFRQQTARLTKRALSEIETLEDWTQRRGEYRRQLLEMLGLDPLPERTPLQDVVTGTVDNGEVLVERLHFQSRPGLYVTANLYRPRQQSGPLPAILYVCGHGGEKQDGVSLGNKTHYQHHGGWFARNGYVCLIIDTIQLGEIEGLHHGTYREQMWWWNSRGYTPAGVEAWNCVRALDYLQSRPEVDPQRLGVTGRSGGGAYSWWIAAIDDRIQVAVPVAGITSLANHVVDGTVEGHCDCMFMVNTYGWDYPMVAALVAPRPLLISNTDKDRIFPLDGVIDLHAKVRRIYELHGAGDKLGLQITEGPHKDTQELHIHAFRWFNRFLRDDDSLIETTATPLFEKAQLRVFDALPADERVTTIHESFVPEASPDSLPASDDAVAELSGQWMSSLREHCFRGWPAEPDELRIEVVPPANAAAIQAIDFTSQQPYRLRMYVLGDITDKQLPLHVTVLHQDEWESLAAGLAAAYPADFPGIEASGELLEQLQADAVSAVRVFVAPRGVGPTEWSRDEPKRTHIRRRFMQLGQTVATMQIYDVRRALQALDQLPELQVPELQGRVRDLQADGEAAFWTIFAALFEDRIGTLTLTRLPLNNREAPDLLNVSRFIDMQHVVRMVGLRAAELKLSAE
jgi:dienelactone hydrolase